MSIGKVFSCVSAATTFSFILANLVVLHSAIGQTAPTSAPASDSTISNSTPVSKSVRATRVNGNSPKLDGRLDDAAWQSADWKSDFLQAEPNQGAPPTEKTEVAILYDNDGLFVAARMTTAHPEQLTAYLDKRDNQGPSEQFIVSIDSYHDRRTAYGFGISVSGVKFDRFNPEDNQYNRDYSYNPVWHGEVSRNADSWCSEMYIPFSQLRFNAQDDMTWGINFNRWIPSRNEDVFWIYVPRNETGWSSRFGDLTGLAEVAPARRIEALPYMASGASAIDGDFRNNPFSDGSEFSGRLGGDLKVGLGPNLTLDGTINPDFGQVEADPAQINLTAFESFFSEKRPFFTEGSSILTGGGGMYYSRRVGAAPPIGGTGDIVDAPRNSSILGAAKISGRLSSGLSLGFLSALTQREYTNNYLFETDSLNAISWDSTYRTEAAPSTLYNVFRGVQEFGANNSIVALNFSQVHRYTERGGRVDSLLRRDAISGGLGWQLLSSGGKYVLGGRASFSEVRGSPYSIYRTQLSSARYYQRPDVRYVRVDSTRTRMTGDAYSVYLNKNSGKHWTGSMGIAVESPDYELNDAGQMSGSDDIDQYASVQYSMTTPGRVLRSYSLSFDQGAGWNYAHAKQYGYGGVGLNVTWANFMSSYLYANRQFPGENDRKTRGGPTMKNEPGYSFDAGLSNSFAAVTNWSIGANYGIDELDGWLYAINGSLSTRVGSHLKLSVSPRFVREDQPQLYVATVTGAGGGEATYGTRYVFARYAGSTLSAQVRVNYFFTPDLSLEVYAEPFAASGRYYRHGELIATGSNQLEYYGESPGTSITEVNDALTGDHYFAVTDNAASFTLPHSDFGDRSFRSNMVLRWEFRPGSAAYLVWQRNLSEYGQQVGRSVRPRSLFDSFGASGEDFVALKVAYWMPIG